jgi:hypothetical protein
MQHLFGRTYFTCTNLNLQVTITYFRRAGFPQRYVEVSGRDCN